MLAQLEGSLITEAGERVQTKCRDTKTHTHTHIEESSWLSAERNPSVADMHTELMMKPWL